VKISSARVKQIYFKQRKNIIISLTLKVMEPKGQTSFPGFRTNSFLKMSLVVIKRADTVYRIVPG